MAQYKTLEDAVDKMMKDYKNAALNSAKYATEKVMEEFKDKAYSELQRYYDSYKSKTKRYKRQGFLKKCIVPYSNVKEDKDSIKCCMLIDYDPSHLGNLYQYNVGAGKPSRFYRGEEVAGKIVPKDFSPLNEFIVNNFLEGIHPNTDGSSEVNAKYIPVRTINIEHLIDNYVDTMADTFQQYFMIGLLRELRKY